MWQYKQASGYHSNILSSLMKLINQPVSLQNVRTEGLRMSLSTANALPHLFLPELVSWKHQRSICERNLQLQLCFKCMRNVEALSACIPNQLSRCREESLQYIKLNQKTLFDWGTSRRRELGKQFCKLNQLKQIHFCVSVTVKVRDHFHNSYMQISCYSPISHVYVKQIGQHIFTYTINLQLLLSRGIKTLDTLAPSGQRRS